MDALMIFFVGMVCGIIVGIFISAIIAASSNGRRDTE